ncbi:MAG TPA: hypothetical protein VIL46_11880, partial [Gemmataceae bacterium]
MRLAAAGLIGLAAGCGQLGLRGERAEPRGDPLLGTFTPSPAPAPPGGGELPGAVERGPGERGPGGRGPEGRPAAGPPPETKLPSSFPLLRGPEITNAAMAAGLRPRPG